MQAMRESMWGCPVTAFSVGTAHCTPLRSSSAAFE